MVIFEFDEGGCVRWRCKTGAQWPGWKIVGLGAVPLGWCWELYGARAPHQVEDVGVLGSVLEGRRASWWLWPAVQPGLASVRWLVPGQRDPQKMPLGPPVLLGSRFCGMSRTGPGCGPAKNCTV